jgi:hypothetical protein
VTHVFTQDQHLYLQFEVYDAAKGKSVQPAAANEAPAIDSPAGKNPGGADSSPKKQRDSIRVLTSVEFLQNDVKVYESKPIVATEVTVPQRRAVVFQLDLPLQSLKPGFYTCQVNIIDDVSGNYAFPRWAMLIKDAPPTPAPAAAPSAGSSSSNK